MKKNLTTLFLLIGLCSFAQTEITDSISHQGYIRTFIVHFPPAYNGIEKLPILMALHGGGSGDGSTVRDRSHFDEVGDTANYITVFPNGYNNQWADGRYVTSPDSLGIDDVSFLSTLLDTLANRYAVDTCKAYITGASNGGIMVQRFACEMPYKFTAYSSVISSMTDSMYQVCNPTIPVSILLMAGTADNFVPYVGGNLGPLTDGGTVIGVDSTINFWVNHNTCLQNIPDSLVFPNIDTTDGSTAISYTYNNCADSSEIVLYKVIGAGHTMPSMELDSMINPVPLLGYINFDIDEAIEIWKFFKTHSKCSEISNIDVQNSFSKLTIFPNPCADYFEIKTNDLEKNLQVSIYNTLGKLIITRENETTIDISKLSKGIYFVKINNGANVISKKIIKQ